MPPDSQNIYAVLIKALELRYGDKHLRDVYCTQLRARRQHAGENLQEFEASIDRLIRLAYREVPEDFRTSFAMQTFTAGVQDNELQQVLRMTRYQSSADALVYALQFEAAKSASGWTSHKVRELKDREGSDDEEEEQGTETRRSAPQNKIRKDGRPMWETWTSTSRLSG